MFKIAVESITWGPHIADWTKTLSEIREAGACGVEVFQSTKLINESAKTIHQYLNSNGDAENFANELDVSDLKLVGLTGGTLASRIEFANRLPQSQKPEYFYLDGWNDPSILKALEDGHVLAIHPHIQRGIQSVQEAFELLEKYPNLRLLPDTAHLFLAGESFLEVIEKYKTRISAIHLKGWNHQFGWARVNYAQGFCGLTDNLPLKLESVRDWIHDNYSGWVVIEQDYTNIPAYDSISRSIDWLLRKKSNHKDTRKSKFMTVPIGDPSKNSGKLIEATTRGRDVFYNTVAESAIATFRGTEASVYLVDMRRNSLTMVGNCEASVDYYRKSVNLEVEKPVETITDDSRNAILERFPSIRNVPSFGSSKREVNIPVFNPFNPNAIDLLIKLQCDYEIENEPLHKFLRYSSFIGSLYHHVWMQEVSMLEQTFNEISLEAESLDQFLGRYTKFIQETLHCRGVSIFLVGSDLNDYRVMSTTMLQGGRPLSECVGTLSDESIWAEVIENRIERNLSCDEVKKIPKNKLSGIPFENVRTSQFSVILAPIIRQGRRDLAIGLIRCTCKDLMWDDEISLGSEINTQAFSIADELLLNAIQEGMGVALRTLYDRDKYTSLLRCLRHEVLNTLMFSKNALSRLATSINVGIKSQEDRLKMLSTNLTKESHIVDNLVQDLSNYFESIDGIMQRTNLLQGLDQNSIGHNRVKLNEVIISPCLYQLSGLIGIKKQIARSKYGVELKVQISRDSLKECPAVFVDEKLLRLVFFNLLLNAVKYTDLKSGFLKLEVSCKVGNEGVYVFIRDWGIGISSNAKEKIFILGYREKKVLECNDYGDGDGIGLWFSKRACDNMNVLLTLEDNESNQSLRSENTPSTEFRLFFQTNY